MKNLRGGAAKTTISSSPVSRVALLGNGTLVMVVWLLSHTGCVHPNNSPPGIVDSTRSFRDLVDLSTGSLRIDRKERSGKAVYHKYCKVCHGDEGDGKGFNSFNLQNSFGIQPANFTDSLAMANRTEERIVLAISNGGRGVGKSQYMPPWGATLTSEEIENVAAYVKTLSKSTWRESK